MKKLTFVLVLVLIFSTFGSARVSAEGEHRVLLFGDSLSSANLNKWHEYITYDHLLVAKGGETSSWVLEQLDILIASGEITQYDTAVVWIGVNDPVRAIIEIPEIYEILHSYDIKIIGVTQWLHYCALGSDTLDKILEFDEIVRSQADLVLDFAVDTRFVNEDGYINKEAAGDCIHMNWGMTDIVSSAVNGAIDELYAPTPTPVPTITLVPTATLVPTLTATSRPVSPISVVTIEKVQAVGEVEPEVSSMDPIVKIVLIVIAIGVLWVLMVGQNK